MNLEELQKYHKELKIADDKIIREEAEMVFLNHLAESSLSQILAFYGGTALRLVYNSPRFSEDIDLIEIKKINFQEFEKFIKKVCKKENWELSDIKNKRQTVFALLKIKDEKLKHPFSLKIEIHKPKNRKKLDLDLNLSLIKSPVSILNPLLLVPSLKNLKNMKEKALKGRNKARDVFDLWYICNYLRIDFKLPDENLNFKEREFKNELQVFLPPKYYPVIKNLYEQIKRKSK